MDRISTLPDDVIDLILENLPTIDRVRTSSLSKCWRLRWTYLSSLIMDEEFDSSIIGTIGKHKNLKDRRSSCIKCILSQYQGCLQEFSLYDPGDILGNHIPFYEDVLHHVTSIGIALERLCLAGGYFSPKWIMPPFAFSLVNLRQLEITMLTFELPPHFKGFPNLTRFMLSESKSSAHDVSRFVSLCPRLEEVILKHTRFDQDIDLKAPQLRHLHLRGLSSNVIAPSAFSLVNMRQLKLSDFRFKLPPHFEGFPNLTRFMLSSSGSSAHDVSRFVSLCPRLVEVILKYANFDQDIDLKAPRLRHLHLDGQFRDVFVSDAQNLESLSWDLSLPDKEDADKCADKCADMYQFLKSFKGLKHLSLGTRASYQRLSRCEVFHMLPRFDQTVQLDLDLWNLRYVLYPVQSLLHLCAFSPNIKKLTITQPKECELCRGELDYRSLHQKYVKADDFRNLVNVDLIGIYGTRIEMDVIELLLHSSHRLEMMHISFVDAHKKPQLSEAIKKLYCASTKVKLHFTNDDRDYSCFFCYIL